VELNELDRLTENGPVYERQGEAQQQRKEWENSALLRYYETTHKFRLPSSF